MQLQKAKEDLVNMQKRHVSKIMQKASAIFQKLI